METLRAGQVVKVHWNKHKKCWSVLDKAGKLAAHVDYLTLADVVFKVSLKGRERVLRTRQRNVHAKAQGIIVKTSIPLKRRVRYNPYEAATFLDVKGIPVYAAELCNFTPDGAFI